MTRFHAFLLILVLSLGSTAFADIYKCVSEDGIVKFSDAPCSKKAAVAFRTEELNFDAVIGNASPYPKLPIPISRYDTEDMVPHAKKIGRYIILDEYNNAAFLRRALTRKPESWNVDLDFGPQRDKRRYTVRMTYRVARKYNDTMRVWLHSIGVKKNRKSYDPQSMANIKTFKKVAVGQWKIKSK